MSDQQGWGGSDESGDPFGDRPKPPAREGLFGGLGPEPEFTDQDVLVAIGKQLKAIRLYVGLTALFAAVTAAFIAAWLTGLITIEFTPTSRGF